jgi:hypothetical protein
MLQTGDLVHRHNWSTITGNPLVNNTSGVNNKGWVWAHLPDLFCQAIAKVLQACHAFCQRTFSIFTKPPQEPFGGSSSHRSSSQMDPAVGLMSSSTHCFHHQLDGPWWIHEALDKLDISWLDGVQR